MVGKFGTKPDGHREPSVRCLIKPLLGFFYGTAGSKKWKAAVDAQLRLVRGGAVDRQDGRQRGDGVEQGISPLGGASVCMSR